jgi:hypothetical protein
MCPVTDGLVPGRAAGHASSWFGGVGHILRPLGLVVVFALCCSVITDPVVLAAAGAVLAASLVVFHEPMDFAFAVYMAAVGALVEYVGVGTGQWSYPRAPAGGVPLWSFAMWGGIGLLSRQLLTPVLERKYLRDRRMSSGN